MTAVVRDRAVDRVMDTLAGRAELIGREAHRAICAGILASLQLDPQAREVLRRDALLAMARDRHVLGRRLVRRLLALVVPHRPDSARWEGWGRITGAHPADAVGHAARLAQGGAQ